MRIRQLVFKIPPKYIFYKLYNLFKFAIFRKFPKAYVPYKPLSMDIEPTTGCNFRCTMCQVSEPNFKANNMTIDTFRNIIKQNLQLIKVKLQGMGEPFVNKYFFEMIEICDEYGVFVETITNGSLLNDKIIEKIINSKSIYRVSISIDGSSKEIFEKIRVKSNFDTVIGNVKKLSQKNKENKNKLNLRAMCLLQKTNYHQLDSMVKLCKDIGFHEFELQVHMTGWGKDEWENKNRENDINYGNKNNRSIKDILNKYNSKSFKASVVENNILTESNKCSYPWHNPYISAQGHVVSCCMVGDSKVNNYGNINNLDFSKIWNSDDYKDLRKSIINHKLKDFCKNCYKQNRD